MLATSKSTGAATSMSLRQMPVDRCMEHRACFFGDSDGEFSFLSRFLFMTFNTLLT